MPQPDAGAAESAARVGPARPDGRRRRGIERRNSIIHACLEVIEENGAAGLTHRSVAGKAGVRPSLVAYYFATLDDLLVAALKSAAEDYEVQYASRREQGYAPLEAISSLIADAADGPGRARAIAERELVLMAARRPALRPIAEHWPDLVRRAAGPGALDEFSLDALIALTDGLCSRVLLDGENRKLDEQAILDHLQHAAPTLRQH